MGNLGVYFIGLVVLLGLSAFFSGAEAALFSLSNSQIRALKEVSRGGRLLGRDRAAVLQAADRGRDGCAGGGRYRDCQEDSDRYRQDGERCGESPDGRPASALAAREEEVHPIEHKTPVPD